MLFFKKKKKDDAIEIKAYFEGTVLPLEKVNDPMFSDKLMGDGVAIEPDAGNLYAPVDGKVASIFDTNHAFSIVTPEGIELFVHFGLDTVQLEGKGFERLVQEGATVKQGTPLIRYDYEFLKANAKSVQTPVIISNYEDYAGLEKVSSGTSVAGQTLVLEVKEK